MSDCCDTLARTELKPKSAIQFIWLIVCDKQFDSVNYFPKENIQNMFCINSAIPISTDTQHEIL